MTTAPRARNSVGLACAGLAVLLAASPAVPTWSAESGAADLVTIDVVVLGEEGRPVRGLAREEFVLAEKGERREIVDVEMFENDPRTFVIVVDDLGVPPLLQAQAREAVARLLSEGFRDGDVVTLATTRGLRWSGTMPSFELDARSVIERIEGKGLSGVRPQRDQRARACLGIVESAARALEGIRGRKEVLLLAAELERFDPEAIRGIYSLCRRAGLSVSVFGLGPSDVQRFAGGADVPGGAPGRIRSGLFRGLGGMELAEATGGRADFTSTDTTKTAIEVAATSGVSYRLSLRPPSGVRKDEWRSIEVSVLRPGLESRAPNGYSRADPGDAADPVDAALSHGHELSDVAIEAAGFVFDSPSRDAVRVLLAVEPGTALGREAGTLDVRVVLTHRDSGQARQARLELSPDHTGTVSAEFEVEPGVVQARVVAVSESGRIGAVTRRIDVPTPKGLRISTPILTDEIRSSSSGQPPQPVLRARTSFSPGGRLYCQFQVYGARQSAGTPEVEGSYLLRHSDGRLIREGEWSPIAPSKGGRLIRLLGVSLEGLAPGGYDIVPRAREVPSGATAEAVGPFEVTQP